MPTVRTTMQPHVDLEVTDTEYAELKKQGLLADAEPTPTPAAAPAKPTTLSKAVTKAKES